MILEYIENGIEWIGEPIDGIRHPRDIEQKWTAEELAEIGLRVRVAPEPEPLTLPETQSRLLAAAWAHCQSLVSAGSVEVATSAGTYHYGIDESTQANLQKALLGVLTNTTPNPRPWTPKGQLAPISVTHTDITTIAAAVGNAYDGYIQAYLQHKAAIMTASAVEDLAAYDVTTGFWPA